MSSSSSSPPRRVLLVDCSGCRTPLQLPPGARAVRCALCNAITGRVLLVDCSGCRTPLQLPPGARAVRCAVCNAITRVGDPRSLTPPPAPHPPQQHQPYGTSSSFHHPSPPPPYINQIEAATEAKGSRKCRCVPLKEIEDATDNFDERYALGQGGEAKVYLATMMFGRSKITKVAVKHLKPNSFGFEDEIQIMSKIQHPNIISLLGYCNDSGQKILIYEYMANGSLAGYLQKKTATGTTTTSSLSWEQRLKICVGAALGLKHLHAETKEFGKGIIHRDIKPDNILLDANWVAKISDFGMFKLSRKDQIDSAMPTMIKGTGGYYAPEYLNYGHVTRKIDVYAFGVVLFQVLCRKMPWDREGESYFRTEDEDLGEWARQNVDFKIRGEISEYCLNLYTKIIQKSLSMDSKKRPTMDEVALLLQNVLQHN